MGLKKEIVILDREYEIEEKVSGKSVVIITIHILIHMEVLLLFH